MMVADEREQRARLVRRPQVRAGACLRPLWTSHTTHLGQTRRHCPASAGVGVEARLFGSSPAAQDPSAGPGYACLSNIVKPRANGVVQWPVDAGLQVLTRGQLSESPQPALSPWALACHSGWPQLDLLLKGSVSRLREDLSSSPGRGSCSPRGKSSGQREHRLLFGLAGTCANREEPSQVPTRPAAASAGGPRGRPGSTQMPQRQEGVGVAGSAPTHPGTGLPPQGWRRGGAGILCPLKGVAMRPLQWQKGAVTTR